MVNQRHRGALSRLYGWIAVSLFVGLIAFAGLNVAAAFLQEAWSPGSHGGTSDWQSRYSLEFLKTVYPDRSDGEIQQLARNQHGIGLLYEPWIEVKSESGITTDVGVHEVGFRFVGSDQGPWPPDLNAFNIFVFGGTAVAGVGLKDDATIPAAIQRILRKQDLGREVNVYNFGTKEHFSTQERLYFEHLLMKGVRPNVAIFIDGYSDFYQWSGEPELADWIHASFVSTQTIHTTNPAPSTSRPPLFWRMVQSLPAVKLFTSSGQPTTGAATDLDPKDPAVIQSVIDRYLRNKRMVEAVAIEFGIVPLFVWLPRMPETAAPDWLRAHYGYLEMADAVDSGRGGVNLVMCARHTNPALENWTRYRPLLQPSGNLPTGFGAFYVAQCAVDFMKEKDLLPGT